MADKKAIVVMLSGIILVAGAGCQATIDTVGGAPNLLAESQSSAFRTPAAAKSSFPAIFSSISRYALETPLTSPRPTTADTPESTQTSQRLISKSTDRLGVLSFNMRHKDRPAELAVMADYLHKDFTRVPDFILCQEVLFKRPKRKGQENTAAVLADLLGYYSKGTKRKSDREGVAIVSRYPFAYYSEKHLKARTNALLLGFRRVSVMGEFLVPGIGRVRVVNIHLAHWPFEHQIRHKQLEETLQWVSSRERDVHADVTLLGGDFNIKPRWPEMSLVTDPSMSGRLKFQNYNSDEPTKGAAGHYHKRVDYIFVSASHRNITNLGEKLLWKDGLRSKPGSSRFWLSDHVPLLHEYSVSSAALATPLR